MDAARVAVVRQRRRGRAAKERERVAARGELDGARAVASARAQLAGHDGAARVVWSAIVGGRVLVARSFWQFCGMSRHYVLLLDPGPYHQRRRPGPTRRAGGRTPAGVPTVVVDLVAAAPDPAPGAAAGSAVDAGRAGGVWVLSSAVRVVLPAPIPQITGDVAVLAGWLGLTIADLTEITDGDPALLAELAASGSVTGAPG